MTDPWWKGRCREIAQRVNFNDPLDDEITPHQVEMVMIEADYLQREAERQRKAEAKTVPAGFPQDQILVALLRGKRQGMTIKEIAEATGRSQSTISQNLRVINYFGAGMRQDWVRKTHLNVHGRKTSYYVLTDKGREVARNRARRMK